MGVRKLQCKHFKHLECVSGFGMLEFVLVMGLMSLVYLGGNSLTSNQTSQQDLKVLNQIVNSKFSQVVAENTGENCPIAGLSTSSPIQSTHLFHNAVENGIRSRFPEAELNSFQISLNQTATSSLAQTVRARLVASFDLEPSSTSSTPIVASVPINLFVETQTVIRGCSLGITLMDKWVVAGLSLPPNSSRNHIRNLAGALNGDACTIAVNMVRRSVGLLDLPTINDCFNMLLSGSIQVPIFTGIRSGPSIGALVPGHPGVGSSENDGGTSPDNDGNDGAPSTPLSGIEALPVSAQADS